MQPLEGPAIFDEAGGEVVEKIWVSGFLTLSAKVAWSCDQRLAEMPGANAIDDDAGSEGGGVAEDAVGELEAAGAVVEGRVGFGEDGDEAAGDGCAGLGDVAAGKDVHVVRLAGFH